MAPGGATNDAGSTASGKGDRRYNHALREVLDELIQHVRFISRSRDTLPTHELLRAQERLEWLADEVWRLTMEADDVS
jgi:hypothetical protein